MSSSYRNLNEPDLHSLLSKHQDNLAYLEKIAAYHGPLDIPLKIVNSISSLNKEIEAIKQELLSRMNGTLLSQAAIPNLQQDVKKTSPLLRALQIRNTVRGSNNALDGKTSSVLENISEQKTIGDNDNVTMSQFVEDTFSDEDLILLTIEEYYRFEEDHKNRLLRDRETYYIVQETQNNNLILPIPFNMSLVFHVEEGLILSKGKDSNVKNKDKIILDKKNMGVYVYKNKRKGWASTIEHQFQGYIKDYKHIGLLIDRIIQSYTEYRTSQGISSENIEQVRAELKQWNGNIRNYQIQPPLDQVPHITIHGDYIVGFKATEVDQRGQSVQGSQQNEASQNREGRMTTFNQQGQIVTYQYNAGGDINFGAVQNRMELVGELEKLKTEIAKAGAANVIDAEIVTDAEYQLTKAVQQAKKPDADKKTILDHINGAKALIEGVTAAGGMVTALVTAADLVQKFF